jgi:BirA family biotin operon repressor/biotin-[acetyl-CoA-carboxylase] ligase
VQQLNAAWVEEQLLVRGARLGRKLHPMMSTASTNDDAKQAAKHGAEHGTCFIAETQTEGRGRRGRSWLAASGEALLFSLVLRPPRLLDPSPLTLVVGLAVHQALQPKVNVPLSVKWPNDVLAGRRKLAGILLEADLTPQAAGPFIVGVGLNVLSTGFPAELAEIATSAHLLGATASREELFVDVLLAIEHWYERFLSEGATGLVTLLSAVDALAGRLLRVDDLVGVAVGFNATGHLLLRDAEGRVHTITAGTVEWL